MQAKYNLIGNQIGNQKYTILHITCSICVLNACNCITGICNVLLILIHHINCHPKNKFAENIKMQSIQ